MEGKKTTNANAVHGKTFVIAIFGYFTGYLQNPLIVNCTSGEKYIYIYIYIYIYTSLRLAGKMYYVIV